MSDVAEPVFRHPSSLTRYPALCHVVSDALLVSLKENAIDLRKIKERIAEPTVSYDAVLKELKKDKLI